jgi:hypothetical protein
LICIITIVDDSLISLVSQTAFRTFSIVPYKKIHDVSEEASSFLGYTDTNPKIYRLAIQSTYNPHQTHHERYQA